MKTIAGLFLLSLAVLAQGLAPAGNSYQLPSYVVGFGAQYNRYARPAAGGQITFAMRLGQTKAYSWVTFDTPVTPNPIRSTDKQSTGSLRTGFAYVAAQNGSCFLFLLEDAGYAPGNGSMAVAAFSGGGGVYCDVGRWFNTTKLYLGPVARGIKAGSTSVQPVIEFMVSKGF